MLTAVATKVWETDSDFRYNPEKGLRFSRHYTQEGVNVFDMFEYDLRPSVIREPSGKVIFEMKEVEVPLSWSQVATDILAQKYFRKAGVPQYFPDGTPQIEIDGSPVLGPETSVKQVMHRLAGTWRYWGEKYGYFASPKDAEIFYDELTYTLLAQMVAPNSPQWFNTGLNWAHGINGPSQGHYYADPETGEILKSDDSYTHPQPHACFIQSVKDDLVNEGGIMDLWVREARLFKYGSGTGTNFSNLRGKGEKLSGGGTSSGLMSWLKIGDRAAGAIKSGGTTRRAAKMVILNVDHPDIEEFVDWKVQEEKKVAALVAAGYDASYESEAYQTVSGQNSNNTVRVTQDYLEAVERGDDWHLRWCTSREVARTVKSKDLWDKITKAAWSCADPGLQFDTTINDWHTCPNSGRINASNPCSEYMFLDDTACNLASINLAHYFNSETGKFDVESFRYTVRIWTVVLEISVLMAQYPSKEIAGGSYNFRTLGLGHANVGSVLMMAGIPYDSIEAMGFAGAITAIMTGESYATSAEMAKFLGPFPKYEENREAMLRVIRNHRHAAYNAAATDYEGLSVTPHGLDQAHTPAYLAAAARESWDKALVRGEKYGFRNAQTTVLAPTGTIGLLMDCSTTGVEPDFALVKFKKLAGGGYFKIVNEAVPAALKNLNYTDDQIIDITAYMKGHGSLKGSPGINHESLVEKGFTGEDLAKIEAALPSVFDLTYALNIWSLGEECYKRLGFSAEQARDANFNVLAGLGFSAEQINAANDFVCGTMTIEGAPHLRVEDYPVFDTANRNGKKGERYIHYLGHIKMMAAVQPFLSGAISKTINMPNEATVEDIKTAYMTSWKLGVKANAIYRDGCKLSQPLSTSKEKEKTAEKEAEPVVISTAASQAELLPSKDFKYSLSSSSETVVNQIVDEAVVQVKYAHDGTSQGTRIYIHGEQRQLPYKRSGLTIRVKVMGQKVFLRTGEYPDGKLGEIFIDMYKEGAAFRSLLNMFAISISTGLQYGIPLEEYVSKFTFTRFEPAGMTDHPNIKFCTSVIDLVFRILGMEYLGRMDFVQVKPQGIQKNRAEQIAKMISEAQGQSMLELQKKDDDEVEKEKIILKDQVLKSQMDTTVTNTVAEETKAEAAVTGANQQLSGMMGDAPPCPTCGHITIRNGSCYKCLNCGSTTGCS
ncbi:MAG: vitamin B12-dependent ribonucleotide reductase [Candidatus Magasanikbacteria bacterium]|nr:vitamin B12-dependent ribonucleotide reductase [Candidatus Magasanikbacteria bacterium]